MKKILLFLAATAMVYFSNAQNVGIGTANPDLKALLDISSTTKGVLFPRMTSIQRTNITAPPNGLVVYDMDKSELYHYDGVAWRALLNSDYWQKPTGTRRRIYNSVDSVGIGTTVPSERLDINGSVRVRNNLTVTGDINFQGDLTRTLASGVATLTPLCYGKVDNFGDIEGGSGNFTLQVNGQGSYSVLCAGIISTSTTIITSRKTGTLVYNSGSGSGIANIKTENSENGIAVYAAFSFIIYK